MKDIFKVSRKSPLKVKGYTYIGQHCDYEDVHYYFKKLNNDNYNLMEAKVARDGRKNILDAGTTIKVLDSFMYNTLKANIQGITFKDRKEFITYVYENSFKDKSNVLEEQFINSYNVKVPSDITKMDIYKEYIKNGYELLYCNKSISDRKFETYSLVLVKKEEYDFFGVKREYTKFKPLVYMTKPSYIKDKGVVQFNEFSHSDIFVISDILNK